MHLVEPFVGWVEGQDADADEAQLADDAVATARLAEVGLRFGRGLDNAPRRDQTVRWGKDPPGIPARTPRRLDVVEMGYVIIRHSR